MREKPNPLLVKLNDIKHVAASAENFSVKRLKIIFNNSESRLKDIPGIDLKYQKDLNDITTDCLKLLEDDPKESYDTYNSRLDKLVNRIICNEIPDLSPVV